MEPTRQPPHACAVVAHASSEQHKQHCCCHTLWQQLGHEQPAIEAQWPKVDEAALTRDSIELVVQVNGKLRTRLEAPASAIRAQGT